MITILPKVSSTKSSFRDLILGRDALPQIELRFGNRRLHPAEIFIVGLRDNQWRQTTLLGAAHAAGVPRSFIPEMLKQIGLAGYENRSPVTLHLRELRRFALACSFFSKSQFLFYDQPFAGEQDEFVEIMAQLMAEAALVTKKVILVSRVATCPRVWEQNPCVVSYDPSLGIQNQEQILLQARGLRGVTDEVTQADYFVTRPHTITRPPVRVTRQEAVHCEKIANPNVSDGLGQKNELKMRPASVSLPTIRGTLTTISARERIQAFLQTNALTQSLDAIKSNLHRARQELSQLPSNFKPTQLQIVTGRDLATIFVAIVTLVLVIGFALL